MMSLDEAMMPVLEHDPAAEQRAKIRKLERELAKEILSKFNLATRIIIVEALWGIDVEEAIKND